MRLSCVHGISKLRLSMSHPSASSEAATAWLHARLVPSSNRSLHTSNNSTTRFPPLSLARRAHIFTKHQVSLRRWLCQSNSSNNLQPDGKDNTQKSQGYRAKVEVLEESTGTEHVYIKDDIEKKPDSSEEDTKSSESVGGFSHLLRKPTAAKGSADKRRALFNRQCEVTVPDLLTVPGIGPRNMEKLVAKGIGHVSELKQLYVDKFRGEGHDKMIEYLQSSVGILHKHHAMRITTFIKDTVERELDSAENSITNSTPKKRLTFCVEGNISVGKTTFLNRVTNDAVELRDVVEIVPEPVAKWQDVGPEHFNILDAFYAEPQRYAYTFQNYVFVTRLMQEQESAGGNKPLRLMERSVFTDRMVFVRAVHEAKWMNEMEISIYDSWFNPVVSALPGLVPDAFIYLRASPDTCHKRLQMRKRSEELSVTIDYLRDLHEKHEQWLFPSNCKSEEILSVTGPSASLIEPLPSILRDRVYYLGGDHVHSSIHKVPALILDCDANIDFTKDVEAKAAYARQVLEFFKYVKRMKDTENKTESHDMNSRVNSLSSNELVMPKGSLFHPQALKSFTLRQEANKYL